MHIFSNALWENVTLDYFISFITSELLGYVAIGCMLQFLKDKGGTIWIPVLIHTIMDYSSVLK